MTARVVIISGFLGAGKTTLIRRLASLCWPGQKLALVENEFGEVGIDGAFLAQTGLAVRELTSGCICCSLAGDFTQALCELVSRFSPEIILIEPSGVAKLSEILRSVQEAGLETACAVTVCDAELCRDYAESFGEFYLDQVKNADLMMLSHIAGADRQRVSDCAQYLGALNPHADVLAVPWDCHCNHNSAVFTCRFSTLHIWRRMIWKFDACGFDFQSVQLSGIQPELYSVYQAAKAISTGSRNITLANLASPELVTDEAFHLIVCALLLAKYGDAILNFERR